ncbi:MarR family winged helix-turn-helix transcriptional regulator [Mitsuokella multacida]|uniref:MarR family winged helix-turn-helix transcriptional regulator n=1 Tax=Mitsuokella multacida TaxID=52226 RepID=UPI001F268382|nr:MarR family transcriptional regulator [Mitsuokella multacida]MCF2585340.1 MarR family transcriptional regulator [Mitsuokella multacida]MDO5583695.1 MarR family transcriptional regulator [Mitsuokella multacida]
MTMSLSFPESSAEISSAFIETLVLIHRNFYRNLTTPVPLNQFATLMTLRLEKQATLSEIGQRLQISKQQMTNICDKLLHAGLITKRQDSEDRRRMLISMTSAGEKILDDQNELVRQRFLSSLRGLSEEERTELRHSITNLNHYIEKMASTPR